MSMNSGIPTQAESSPLCGRNHSIITTLASTAIGPIEMSRPPPPDRIAGVEASATIANGASVASSAGQWPGLPKFGSATMFAISRPAASAAANSQGRLRSCSAKEGSDNRLARQVAAGQFPADRAFSEDEDAVHQLDVLVDLGREHHDRHTALGQVDEQLVEVALGADVHPARRVVEQQDPRLGRQPTGHDDLLLVATRQGRDRILGVAELDLQPVDVLAQPLLRALGRQQPASPVAAQRRYPEVLAHRLGLEQRLGPPLARHVGDIVATRVSQRLEEGVLSMALEAGQADELAGP